MDARERALVFESAMEDYRAGLNGVASRSLRQLVEDGSRDPLHLSYCGLLWALTERRIEESVDLCRRAVDADGRRSSELYWNLAQVLALGSRRREAIDALSEGLRVHPDEVRLRQELQHLVPRAKPAIRRLPRNHPLNKYLGMVRTVGTRLFVTFIPRVRRVGPPRASQPGGRASS
jgi:predicted Zn-dependent protease